MQVSKPSCNIKIATLLDLFRIDPLPMTGCYFVNLRQTWVICFHLVFVLCLSLQNEHSSDYYYIDSLPCHLNIAVFNPNLQIISSKRSCNISRAKILNILSPWPPANDIYINGVGITGYIYLSLMSTRHTEFDKDVPKPAKTFLSPPHQRNSLLYYVF